jgi:hypothetical protein
MVACANCRRPFEPRTVTGIYCSAQCRNRMGKIISRSRGMVKRAANGTLQPQRCHGRHDPYTVQELADLRADPRCVLPDRSLAAQWWKCEQLGIPRDPSLRARRIRSPEQMEKKIAQKKAELRSDRGPAIWGRWNYRKRVRKNPERYLAELRSLAHGHQYAEDLVVESFVILLRLAIPAAEAFKLAKAEVNRTSAQPFREQSINPNVDYAARETGRQAPRASNLRAARGDG